MSPKFKLRSVVWNYFCKTGEGRVLCTLCNKSIKYFGGTTNLRQHLLRKHPGELDITPKVPEEPDDECQDQSVGDYYTVFCSTTQQSENVPSPGPSGVTSINDERISSQRKRPAKQLSLGSVRKLSESKVAEIDSKLLQLITKDFQPVSLVEKEGFLAFTHELEPLYQPPSKKQLTCDILPKHYIEAASVLKSVLNEVEHCAITTDIWTSDSNRNYLTVTSHFIYEIKIQARVLATEELFGSNVVENIAEQLTKISTDWDINDKIVTIISDDGANVKKAITEGLGRHHHPCVAHTLNLSVTEALSSNEKLVAVLKKCRTLVGYFKYSVVASEKLKTVQQQMGLPIVKVKRDVATRWNSCFVMLERLVSIKDPLRVAVTNLPKAPKFLNADEWRIIEDCIEVLKPANYLTTILSKDKYPTVSPIIPLIRGLQFTLTNVSTETGVGENLKNSLLITVTCKLGDFETNKTIAKACFLDPRFKKVGFGLDDNADNAQRFVTEELTQLIASRIPDSKPTQMDSELLASNNDIWFQFDNELSKIKTSSPSAMVGVMVRQYLEMPLLERKKDPLEFWVRHKLVLPEMYELAMKYLCVPATSVPSERVFSKSGELMNCRRNGLESDCVNYIVFLNSEFE